MLEQHYIETARGKFEYFTAGEGEPLAITHYYSAFDERGNWFANPFTARYKVFLINSRGAGNSDDFDNEEQRSFTEIVRDLEAVRAALGFKKWALAGHSTGGMLALHYAVTAQDSLTKVIAGSTAASKAYASHPDSIYCTDNQNFQRIIEIMELLNNPLTKQEDRASLSYEWTLMSFYSEERLKQALSRPNSGRTVGTSLDYFRKVVVKSFDLRPQLRSIHIPTYIFAGRFDAQCPVEFGIEIAELIPQARLTIFEQSNHFPFAEEEAAFNEFVVSTQS